jgi:lipopolysaccharide export system permease protein
MKILDRYLLKTYGRVLGAVTLAFLALLIIFALIDDLDDFLEYEASWSAVVRYVLFSVPHTVVQFFPLAVLLTLVFTVHQLMKWGEVVGMLAGGVSLQRISSGFILVAFLLAIAQFLVNEYVAAWSQEQARRIMVLEIKEDSAGYEKKSGYFVRGAENRFYHCSNIDQDRNLLYNVEVFRPNAENSFFSRHIRAKEAEYRDDVWVFHEGEELVLDKTRIVHQLPFVQRIYDFPETPENFFSLTPSPKRMGLRQLMDHMAMLRSSGEDPSRYLADLHYKVALPVSCVIFSLIALSVSLRMKGGHLSTELGVAIFCAVAYYSIAALMIELGRNELIAAWLAAWGPVILFGAIGIFLFLKTRTDY